MARSGRAQRVDAVGDDPQRVDVEARVGLVEDGELRLEHRHLEDLVALLLAAGEALVDRAAQEALVHLDELHPLLGQGAGSPWRRAPSSPRWRAHAR